MCGGGAGGDRLFLLSLSVWLWHVYTRDGEERELTHTHTHTHTCIHLTHTHTQDSAYCAAPPLTASCRDNGRLAMIITSPVI